MRRSVADLREARYRLEGKDCYVSKVFYDTILSHIVSTMLSYDLFSENGEVHGFSCLIYDKKGNRNLYIFKLFNFYMEERKYALTSSLFTFYFLYLIFLTLFPRYKQKETF